MIFLTILWIIVWLVVLASALSRKDVEPVTKLTWILVIILVPVFGVVLYWVVAPAPPLALQDPSSPCASGTVSGKDYQDENYRNQPTVCIMCKTTIPAGATACLKCGWSYLKGG
jgi:ribosomal protein L40E